jgi:D-xylose transport system substrate-binding protein
MSLKTALMVVSLIISVIIGIILASRGKLDQVGGGDPDRKLRIGLSLDTVKEPRWVADKALFEARCKELGAEVFSDSADGDDVKQVQGVNTLLSKGIDVLVIVAHDGRAMAKAVQNAQEAKVPVIAYDRLIMDSDVAVYLSFDNEKVGRLQAQWLLDHLPTPGKGKIVRVCGAKTDNNAQLFKKGQDDVLKPYIDRGDVKIVFEDWADDWRTDNAKKIVMSAITTVSANGFDAVLAMNDSTAAGAYQAMLEHGIDGKKILTGQDADLVACQRIVAGKQSMTVYKPLKKLATKSAELAVAIAKREPIVANSTTNNGKIDVPSVLGDIIAVDKNNMDSTVIADGFHTREAVYGSGK